jgi:hypothetical protein
VRGMTMRTPPLPQAQLGMFLWRATSLWNEFPTVGDGALGLNYTSITIFYLFP